jgi:sialic acid synthase SpsE
MKFEKKKLNSKAKTFFIADIAANHDGSLARAKKLIKLSAKAGANAAKFQHFKAETIVSDYGFKKIGKFTHQKKWKKSVFDVYKEASINPAWTFELKKTCSKYKIQFMTTPYDLEYVDYVKKFITAYKIGSGDITWHEILNKISKKKLPVILATGASSMNDVKLAVNLLLQKQKKIVLMQCNTNYTNDDNQNLKHLNLRVLQTYRKTFGNKIILGLSDHTQNHDVIIGAVALGAKVIERHFTDNNNRKGPDHKFSLNPRSWSEMVSRVRIFESTMGDGKKKIESNEKFSVLVQRRSIRAAKNLKINTILQKKHFVFLRPKSKTGLDPYYISKIIGKRLKKDLSKHEEINWVKIKL